MILAQEGDEKSIKFMGEEQNVSIGDVVNQITDVIIVHETYDALNQYEQIRSVRGDNNSIQNNKHCMPFSRNSKVGINSEDLRRAFQRSSSKFK